MKTAEDLVKEFGEGKVSRRDFFERTATGGLSLFATASALTNNAKAESNQSSRARQQAGAGHADHQAIREIYAAELRKSGIQVQMPSRKGE